MTDGTKKLCREAMGYAEACDEPDPECAELLRRLVQVIKDLTEDEK